MDGPDTDFNA